MSSIPRIDFVFLVAPHFPASRRIAPSQKAAPGLWKITRISTLDFEWRTFYNNCFRQ